MELHNQNDKIKESIDLREFSKDYLYVRTQGKNCVSSDCVCGNKQQQNKKDVHCQIFKENVLCYVCDKSFDAFDLVQEKEKCNFITAKQKLAAIVGLEIEKPSTQNGVQLFFNKEFELTCIHNQHNNFSKFCNEVLGISYNHLKTWGVGTFGNKLTIFLQKDLQGKVWNYQAISYNENCKKTGTLFSATQPDCKKNEIPNYYSTLLYGFHLLRDNLNIPIIVTESPKTAVIASFFYPQYDFVACMSANGLTDYFCTLLKNTGKSVYWLADADGNEENEKGKILYGGRLNSSIEHLANSLPTKSFVIDLFSEYTYYNNRIESKYHYDIADFLIDNIAEIKARTKKLPDLMLAEKIYSASYWSKNVFITQKKEMQFWKIATVNKSVVITVVKNLYIDFLVANGYYYIDYQKEKVLVVEKDNVIEETDLKSITDFVVSHIQTYLPHIIEEINNIKVTREMLLNVFYEKCSVLFGESLINVLPTNSNVNFLKDTKTTAYRLYKNGVIVVKKDVQKVDIIAYKDLGHYKVWKTDIIDRNFKQLDLNTIQSFNFYKFLELTQHDELESKKQIGLNNLLKSLGYLLHSYKSEKEPKLIVAIDKGIDSDEKGGTGKSIVFHKSLKYATSVAYQDGKTWDYKKSTIFDFIQGEKVACINDLAEGFDMPVLYNATTDDIKIRVLYKNGRSLSFQDSPKFVVTTNFTIKGETNADYRRLHFVEFSSWFMRNNTTIEKKFGETFFQDWNVQDWNKFDNVMVYCLQIWLDSFALDKIKLAYDEKKMYEQLTSEEIDRLNDFFKPAELGGEWIKGVKLPKNEICEFVYPLEERISNNTSLLWCQKRLKSILEIYFKNFEFEVSLHTTKNKYPYWSDGKADYVLLK